MPEEEAFRIHRFGSNAVHGVRCSEEGCDWPTDRASVNRTIADAMEHAGHSGHRVRINMTDHYELSPPGRAIIAPTMTELARLRGLELDDRGNEPLIHDAAQRERWGREAEQLRTVQNQVYARRRAGEILMEIARAARLDDVTDICRELMEPDE